MALTKFELAKQYASTIKQAQLIDQALTKAFKLLDEDNEVYYSGPIHKAYDALVEQLLGQDFYEYILHWIYELDFGRRETQTFEEYLSSHLESYRYLKHD
jgi:hypothetical protein